MEKSKYLYGALVLVLCVMRFVFLDQDAPSYMVGGICQEDEAYYVTGAIERYNIDQGLFIEGTSQTDGEVLMLATVPLTYLSFKIFGDNYYGLRIPAVILSLLSLLLLLLIFRRNKGALAPIALFGFTLLLFFDFYFALFSRFQTPQIYSIFGISLLLWVLYRPDFEKPKYAILAGNISVLIVLLIYPYNAFASIAVGLMYCWKSIQLKNVKPLIFLGTGVVSGFILFHFFAQLVGSSLENYLDLLTRIRSVRNETDLGIHAIKNSLFGITNTNFLRYNLSYFLFLALGLILMISEIKKDKKNTYLVFPLLCFVMAYVQGIFISSYPFKKWIVLFPLVITIVGYAISNLDKVIPLLKKRGNLLILFFFVFFAAYSFKVNNSPMYWSGFKYWYYENTPLWLNLINVGCLLLALAAIVFRNKLSLAKYRIISISTLLITGFCLSYFYMYRSPEFEYRNTLTAMAADVDNKAIVGDFAHAYCFYNNSIPMLNPYRFATDSLKEYYENLVDSNMVSGVSQYRLINSDKDQDFDPEKLSAFINRGEFNLKIKKKYSISKQSLYLLEINQE